MNLKERAKHLKTDIPAVFIALKKKETPLPTKLLAAVTVAYALSPVDLIPDFIPVLVLIFTKNERGGRKRKRNK